MHSCFDITDTLKDMVCILNSQIGVLFYNRHRFLISEAICLQEQSVGSSPFHDNASKHPHNKH